MGSRTITMASSILSKDVQAKPGLCLPSNQYLLAVTNANRGERSSGGPACMLWEANAPKHCVSGVGGTEADGTVSGKQHLVFGLPTCLCAHIAPKWSRCRVEAVLGAAICRPGPRAENQPGPQLERSAPPVIAIPEWQS